MTPECDYPKVKWLVVVFDGTELISAVQDTFEGRTYRRINGQGSAGEVCTATICYDTAPESATVENNRAISNYRVVEEVHPNTVRAVFRRAGYIDKQLFSAGRWYRVIED